MALSLKINDLCKEYMSLTMKINEYEAFVSSDAVKTAMNYYSLGSKYREIYGTIIKLSAEGYVQMEQIEKLMEEYREECKRAGISPTTSTSAG